MITLSQAKKLRRGDILTRSANGKVYNWKVNGQVKLWKKDENRVAVPLKHGLYDYFTLTEHDLHSFDPPARMQNDRVDLSLEIHQTIKLSAGQSITLLLPSGTKLDIEVTSDTATVSNQSSDQVYYGEDLDYTSRKGGWLQTWPQVDLADIMETGKVTAGEYESLMGEMVKAEADTFSNVEKILGM